MTGDGKQMVSFLTEELKENWAYIRHIEELRLKHTHIFLIITGAIISVFSFLIKVANISSPQQSFTGLSNFIVTQYGVPITVGSGFIFLYGLFLCIFLARQKRGYQHYRMVNADIRKWFTDKYGEGYPFRYEKELSPKRTTREVINSTFFYWYLLVVLVNVFAFVILLATALALIAPSSWSLKLIIIPSVIVSFFGLIIIECYIFAKINKESKVTSS